MAEKTLFQKILHKEIPGNIVYEDTLCFILEDINPQAPFHFLIIPKEPIARLQEAQKAHLNTLGHLLLVAKEYANTLGLQEGFRVVINSGPLGGETVPHLHVHLLSGRPMKWPPG